MAANPAPELPSTEVTAWGLAPVGTFSGLRALAWQGNVLYASRGYDLLKAEIGAGRIAWQPVGRYRPEVWRRVSSLLRLTSRLFRDGFHALAVLPTGQIVGAVPGAIVTLFPGEEEFRISHKVMRGTRPLHITATPAGRLFWGEYFDNARRDEVHIYGSADQGATWNVVYTFPAGAIRHVHNIVYDPWENCLWTLTGDNGSECRILRASLDFKNLDVALSGNQQARAVALVPAENGLYFSSDTPLERNHIYHLDRRGNVTTLGDLESSSIYGCRAGNGIFFSTMAEPSQINSQANVNIYGSLDGTNWQKQLWWAKDRWPMGLFQYGNAFLPDGNNSTRLLAVSTIAIKSGDLETSLWSIAGE
jgi:hypothetical protein